MPKWRRLLVGGVAAAATLVPEAVGAVPKNGLVIACSDGRYLTRSNGVSWWEVDSPITKEPTGSVFTSRRIRVSYNGEVVYDKSYGAHVGQSATTCTGPELADGTMQPIPGSLWEVELSEASA